MTSDRAHKGFRLFLALKILVAALVLAAASEAGERIKLDGYILWEARAERSQGGHYAKPKALEWFEELRDCTDTIKGLVKPEHEIDLQDRETIERIHHIKTEPEARYFYRVKWQSWPNGLWAASNMQLLKRGSDTVLGYVGWSYRCESGPRP